MSLFLSEYVNYFKQDVIEMMKRDDLAKCYNITTPHFAQNECLAQRPEPGSQAFF